MVIKYTFENLSDHYTNTGCSQFEVFYGRQSNFETSRATGEDNVYKISVFLVSMIIVCVCVFPQSLDSNSTPEELVQTHLEAVQMIREKAASASQKAAEDMKNTLVVKIHQQNTPLVLRY